MNTLPPRTTLHTVSVFAMLSDNDVALAGGLPVAVGTEVTVADVIGQNENDVGYLLGRDWRARHHYRGQRSEHGESDG